MELFTKITGNGPPLLILHGLFGSWENWGSQIRLLAEDFTIYAMDARNHGRSPHTEAMDYDAMSDDVLLTLEKHGLGQVSVIGHSMGGKTAMQVALKSPQSIDRLVVVDIAPRHYEPGHNEIFQALCEMDLSTLQSRAEADEFVQQWIDDVGIRAFVLKNLVRIGDGFDWKMNLPVIREHYPALLEDIHAPQRFDGPVLFVKGAKSDYIRKSDQTRISHLFQKKKKKIIDGAGHWPHSEKASVFYKIVNDFLQGDDRPRDSR
ncbi:MAG: alpha/beta fold hydrolase [Gammaproteobacteria bacterium]|nr:alpha/beta fold hydrolase [Gammaproteobacteria bacterium]